MSKNRLDFEDKLKLATINRTKKDVTHRKPFVDDKFSGTASLVNFVGGLRCKSMACTGWQSTLNIDTIDHDNMSLLDRFNSITEEEMTK